MAARITREMLAHAKVIIAEIARNRRIPESEIRAEMMVAMRAGMANPDPDVQKQWSEIHWRGAEPTVEEFIAWTVLKAESEVSTEKEIN